MEEKLEEKLPIELCAIPKEMAERKLKELIEANNELFQDYFMWVNVINSHVKIEENIPTKSDN